MRKVKILATLGPASNDRNVIEQMLNAGVDGVRLNFSHGDRDSHKAAYTAVREAAEALDRAVAVVADLQGPKIRVGNLDAPLKLEKGETVAIVPEESKGEGRTISCTYDRIADDVSENDTILIDDGRIELIAERIENNTVICTVIEGGMVGEHKGINLPGVAVSAASITEKDEEDLKFSLDLGVDYIAVSFVRTGAGLRRVREIIQSEGRDIPVIAKIEKPEALENLDAIIEESSGLMVARGDLAVETSAEKVPILQKMILKETNRRGKPDIVATQMLESMIEQSSPTRAESADVANAVLDGADTLMLSGETAVGKYPVQTVRMMDKIIRYAEESLYFEKHSYLPDRDDNSLLNGITHAAGLAADETRAAALAVYSLTGEAASMISQKRPDTDIIAFTPDAGLYNRFSLYYGVRPVMCERVTGWEKVIEYISRECTDRKLLARGDTVVCLINDDRNNHILRIMSV